MGGTGQKERRRRLHEKGGVPHLHAERCIGGGLLLRTVPGRVGGTGVSQARVHSMLAPRTSEQDMEAVTLAHVDPPPSIVGGSVHAGNSV